MFRGLLLNLGFGAIALAAYANPPGWRLVWNDEFNAKFIDKTKWAPCERGKSDWNNTMTRDPRCFRIGGESLKLFRIVKPDTTEDKSPFLTGWHHQQGEIRTDPWQGRDARALQVR